LAAEADADFDRRQVRRRLCREFAFGGRLHGPRSGPL